MVSRIFASLARAAELCERPLKTSIRSLNGASGSRIGIQFEPGALGGGVHLSIMTPSADRHGETGRSGVAAALFARATPGPSVEQGQSQGRPKAAQNRAARNRLPKVDHDSRDLLILKCGALGDTG